MANIKGRAEYEIADPKLFEDKPASEIYPFARDGKGVGMIVGERGYGKTFFARKLARELSGKIYGLNKNTLEYGILDDCQNPHFIAVDDLHYQMRAMKLNDLIGKPNDEHKILGRLYGFKEEAQALDIPLIFISDEGPAGLYTRFKGEANQKKFLELLEGCVASQDDSHRFQQQLGKYYTQTFKELDNVLRFRDKINQYLTVKIKQNLNMTDVPLIIPEDFLRLRARCDVLGTYNVGVKQSQPDQLFDIFRIDGGIISRGYLEIPRSEDSYIKCSLIRPIRELKVLSDELKEISRETLGVDFGGKIYSTIHYSPNETLKLSNLIKEKYDTLAEKTYLPLAKALLSTDNDDEMRAYLIGQDLAQD